MPAMRGSRSAASSAPPRTGKKVGVPCTYKALEPGDYVIIGALQTPEVVDLSKKTLLYMFASSPITNGRWN
jgi:hypothetical protein